MRKQPPQGAREQPISLRARSQQRRLNSSHAQPSPGRPCQAVTALGAGRSPVHSACATLRSHSALRKVNGAPALRWPFTQGCAQASGSAAGLGAETFKEPEEIMGTDQCWACNGLRGCSCQAPVSFLCLKRKREPASDAVSVRQDGIKPRGCKCHHAAEHQ